MPDIRTDRLDGEASVVKVIDLLDAPLVDVYALDALRLRTESSLGAAFP